MPSRNVLDYFIFNKMDIFHKAIGGGKKKQFCIPSENYKSSPIWHTKTNSPGLLFQPPESEFLVTAFHNWNTYHNVYQVYFQHSVPKGHQNNVLSGKTK